MCFEDITHNRMEEALDVFRRQGDSIDLVLLDLTMPVMNGEDAFRELRLLDPKVKVILTSGFSKSESASRFVGRGLAGFIQKPFKIGF